jgi:hypothetical protein
VSASNPMLDEIPCVTWYDVAPPSTITTPARPARAPASAIASIVLLATFMPAVRAAAGLAPTARSRNPMVLRENSHHTPIADAMPRMTAKSNGSELPAMCGRRAEPSTTLLAWSDPAAANHVFFSRYCRPYMAM